MDQSQILPRITRKLKQIQIHFTLTKSESLESLI